MSPTGPTDPQPSTAGRLLSLEAGRAVAALMVAGFHVEGLCKKYFGGYGADNIMRGGYAGVDYFFVLSGFIIYAAHRLDIGREQKVLPFAIKRAIRILPMYWLVLGLLILTYLLKPQWSNGIQLSPGLIVSEALLLPNQVPQMLQPAWTLQREFLFYLLFAVIIAWPRFGLILFSLWQAAILASMALFDFPFASVPDIFFGPHNLGFAGGLAIAYGMERKLPSISIAAIAAFAGIASFIILLGLDWYIGRDTAGLRDNLGYKSGTVLYTASAMLIVYGLVGLEKRGRLRIPAWLAVIGGASYLIYLLHEPLSSLLTKLMLANAFPLHVSAAWAYAGYLIGTTLVAVVIHQIFERPILNHLRARFLPKRTN